MSNIRHFGSVPWLHSIPLLSILPLCNPLLIRLTASPGMSAVFLFVLPIDLWLVTSAGAIFSFVTTGSVCVFHMASFRAASWLKPYVPRVLTLGNGTNSSANQAGLG